MQNHFRMVLSGAALIGLMFLTATSADGKGKTAKGGKQGKSAQKKGNHSHIYAAIKLLHEACHNAKSSSQTLNRFGGHRNEAVKLMGHAIKELELALKHVKAKPAPGAGKIVANNMPMHHALKQASESLASANAAPHNDNMYGGHRNKAVTHLEHAIKQLHEGLKYHEAHPMN
jgi:hypothetical protein